uniref:Myosin light chain kinase, smooth muscle-like n=1 Tax=Chelydra serpentina TaxID=8475 RepID=A0A8C3S2F6_CHESE
MNLLHHPRLVQCLAAFQSRAELVMVMDYVAGGELFERMVDDDFELTEPTSIQYVRQILEGMQYVHRQSIVHLDLKPENIVCVSTSSHWVKIIDFGLARRLGEQEGPVKVMHGTPEFVAPEVIAFEPVGFATDMWSIGVICYILLSGDSPFQGNSDMETLRNVTAAQWEFDEETFSEISQEAKDFIGQLLQKDSRCRLPSDQALAHPWLQKTESDRKVLSKERMRRFLARQKWQKTGNAVLALRRMSRLAHKLDDPVTTPSAWEKGGNGPGNGPACQNVLTPPPPPNPPPPPTHTRFPHPEVTWLRNDVPVQECSQLRIDCKENGSCSLTLAGLSVEDTGHYVCRATSAEGEAECSARLTVLRGSDMQTPNAEEGPGTDRP